MIRMSSLPVALAFLFGASLNIAVPVPLGTTWLNVAASDLLFPAVFLVAAAAWWLSGRPRPQLDGRLFLALLGVLTVILVAALVHGRLEIGRWTTWAVVNRGIGWAVVLGYLAVGLWMGMRPVLAKAAVVGFVLAAGGVAAATTVASLSSPLHGDPDLLMSGFRGTGLIGNPNALAYLSGMALLINEAMAARSPDYLSRRLSLAISVALICVIVLTRSRSVLAPVAAALLIGSLPMLRLLDWRRVAGTVAAAAAILYVAIVGLPEAVARPAMAAEPAVAVEAPPPARQAEPEQPQLDVGESYREAIDLAQQTPSIDHRLEITRAAIDYWLEEPLFGVGLGVFYHRDVEAHGTERGVAIHSTPLWLLVETGIFGLAAAGALLGLTAVTLWRRRADGSGFAAVGLIVVVFAAGASLGNDFGFQRYFWVILGICLSASAAARAKGRKAAANRLAVPDVRP